MWLGTRFVSSCRNGKKHIHIMKKIITLATLSTGICLAGEPVTSPAAPPATPPPLLIGGWLTPTLDVRTRYEYADIDNAFNSADALTLRVRPGFKTKAWNGLSAVVEGEFSRALVDDYHGGAPGADPFNPTKYDAIADPETTEFNQVYLQYQNFDTVFKVGRQRMVLNNAAFIGNVGWRQNEQTYDGLSIVNNSIDKLTLTYAYFNQVNRIFGSDADGIFENFEGDVHLLNASYTGIEKTTLGAYIYLMDFDDAAVAYSNNTYGVMASTTAWGLNFYGEVAFQTEGASAQKSKDAGYFHGTVAKTIGVHTVTAGYEYLDAGFAAPLSTAHAFNGFADVFVAERLLGGKGLANPYLTYATTLPFYGIKSATTFHMFGDNNGDLDYGYEFDQVFSKKFSNGITGIVKAAYFVSEDDKYPDTFRLSLEANYLF
jgi:outer membrane porin, OprD family